MGQRPLPDDVAGDPLDLLRTARWKASSSRAGVDRPGRSPPWHQRSDLRPGDQIRSFCIFLTDLFLEVIILPCIARFVAHGLILWLWSGYVLILRPEIIRFVQTWWKLCRSLFAVPFMSVMVQIRFDPNLFIIILDFVYLFPKKCHLLKRNFLHIFFSWRFMYFLDPDLICVVMFHKIYRRDRISRYECSWGCSLQLAAKAAQISKH
jgi:hypothetical protein